MERLYAQHLDKYLPQLAHHYSRSDDRVRALHYLLRFGDSAARMYANLDAVGCYRRALELLAQQDDQPELKAEVLEKLADTHDSLGEPEAALEFWQAALTRYETLGQKERLAAVHRKIGLHWWGQGNREKAIAYFQHGLDLLAEQPENGETALLYHEMGRLHFRSGDDQQAIVWAQKALERDTGSVRRGPLPRLQYAWDLSRTSGELEEGIAQVKQSLRIALQHDYLCRRLPSLHEPRNALVRG